MQSIRKVSGISNTAILLIHCQDKQGILAAVTEFLNDVILNKPKLIISCDPETKIFIEKFQTQLEKTASLLSVSYEQTEGEEILVGDKKIKLELSI